VPVRTERYKPTSWLGIMIGARLYIDCLNEDEADECAMRLTRELVDRGRRDDGVKSNTTHPLGGTTAAVSDADKQTDVGNRQTSFVGWTEPEVQIWLTQNKLAHLCPKFDGFDGRLLKQLQIMYRNSPGTAFCQSLRDMIDVHNLRDLLHFANILDELK
jgi:hypothetical protein